MKKLLSILTVVAMVFSLSSCGKADEAPEKVKKYNRADTVTENTLATNTLPDEITQAPENEVAPEAIRDKYQNHVYYHFDKYYKFNGEESIYDPVFVYADIDNDSVEEMIYFLEFNSTEALAYRFAYVYIFDYRDNTVTEVFGTDNAGLSRLTDRIRVYKENGKYYIVKTNNDGNAYQVGMVYSYNGSEIVPEFGMQGCLYEPYVLILDYGVDAFSYTDNFGENGENISLEEYERIQDEFYTRGETVFFSSDNFAEDYTPPVY